MLRRFDHQIAEKIVFLCSLVNSFNWGGEEERQFQKLKECLRNMLKNPRNFRVDPALPLDCWDGRKQEGYRSCSDSGGEDWRSYWANADIYRLHMPQVCRDKILNHQKRTLWCLFCTQEVQEVSDGQSFPLENWPQTIGWIVQESHYLHQEWRLTKPGCWFDRIFLWRWIRAWRIKLFSWLALQKLCGRALLLPWLSNGWIWKVLWGVLQKQMETIHSS